MFAAVSPCDINNLKHKGKKIKQPKISTYIPSFKEAASMLFYKNSKNHTKVDYTAHLLLGKSVYY